MPVDIEDLKKFESRFFEEETELVFLAESSVNGAYQISKKTLRPSIEFIASYHPNTGIFSKTKGRLEWLIENTTDRSGWGYDFRKYNIYHIRCRRNKPIELKPNMLPTINNCYMVLAVLDDGMTDKRLEKLRAAFLKPVTFEDPELGTFELDKEASEFHGTADWYGKPIAVNLCTDRYEGKTAKRAFARFKELVGSAEEIDRRIRESVADELLALAEEWADGIPVSRELLVSALRADEMLVEANGQASFWYTEDREIFAGHSIEVVLRKDGSVKGANLAG